MYISLSITFFHIDYGDNNGNTNNVYLGDEKPSLRHLRTHPWKSS